MLQSMTHPMPEPETRRPAQTAVAGAFAESGAAADHAVVETVRAERRAYSVRPLTRLMCLPIIAGGLTLLTLSARLTPDASGTGTHEQLGLAPCGFKLSTGYPCMSCGMTTAFAHMAHGQVFSAVAVQPMGAVLYVLTAAAIAICGITALTGQAWPSLSIRLYDQRLWMGLLALWLASWVLKIWTSRSGDP